MNKKFLKIFCFLLFVFLNTAQAENNYIAFVAPTTRFLPENEQEKVSENKFSTEVRCAAFVPTSVRFRKIYGDVGADYQTESSVKFAQNIHGWINFSWFPKSGHSVGLHDHTTLNIPDLSLGIKFPYRFHKKCVVYAGIGPAFAMVYLRNHGHCAHQNASSFGLGGCVKSGFNFFFSRTVFLDVFADYYYLGTFFKDHVNAGGLKAGLGLGGTY